MSLKYAGLLLNPNLTQDQVVALIEKDQEAQRVEHEKRMAYLNSITDPIERYKTAEAYIQIALRVWMGF